MAEEPDVLDDATTFDDAETLRPKRQDGDVPTLGRIDQYSLERELGGGGFGTVFLARDTVSDTLVAVKGLPPEVRNNLEELENIRDNFKLVSRLHHPNIAAALVLHPAKSVSYADGSVRQKLRVDPNDTLMVMEYAPGTTLSRWRKSLPDRRVPAEDAVRIVRQIASALDFAHARKIIHRDIKPANVMVETQPGGEIAVRVLDFGLAAEVRSSMGRVSCEIRDTSGTRPYMAPEQWAGEKQGDATDQYSLAVLYCELVAGEVPFQGVFESGDPVMMLAAITTREPNVPQGVPARQRKAVRKALSKSPGDRYPTCMAFVEALEKGSPSAAGKVVVACMLLALAGGAGYWALRSRRQEPAGGALPNQSAAMTNVAEGAATESTVKGTTNLAVVADAANEQITPRTNLERVIPTNALETVGGKEPPAVANDGKAKDVAADEEAERLAHEAAAKAAVERLAREAIAKAEAERLAREAAAKAEAERQAREAAAKAEAERRAQESAAKAEAERQKKEADERMAKELARLKLVERLRQGSEFLPDPPKVAAGTKKALLMPEGVKMSFVWCPPGRFLMGSPDDEDRREGGEVRHVVTLTKGFWIGEFEVTREQWKTFMGRSRFMFTTLLGNDGRYPVDDVNWNQCQEFCRQFSAYSGYKIRLPTEAEWEYACRAGTSTPFNFGSALNGDKARCAGATDPYGTPTPGENSYTGSALVGSYQRNPWGIYDMHGNVFEWCADWHGEYPEGDVEDPKGPERGSSRIVRGGCWNYAPTMCRSAFRGRKAPVAHDSSTGFRVCMEEE